MSVVFSTFFSTLPIRHAPRRHSIEYWKSDKRCFNFDIHFFEDIDSCSLFYIHPHNSFTNALAHIIIVIVAKSITLFARAKTCHWVLSQIKLISMQSFVSNSIFRSKINRIIHRPRCSFGNRHTNRVTGEEYSSKFSTTTCTLYATCIVSSPSLSPRPCPFRK